MKLWKIVVAALVIGALSLTPTGSALAASDAMEMDTCPHEATIASLHECVTHAAEMGHITSPVIADRLHGYLSQADLALARGRGQEPVAANWLDGFNNLVKLSAARGLIDPLAAQHLIEHSNLVQHALHDPAR